jgi:hypothetical protein
MKKMKLLICLFFVTVLIACGQKAQTFDKVATFNAGFRFSPTGTIYTSMPTSTTADWNTLLNKPLTFPSTWATVSGKPTVFNPDLTITNPLYKPIGWKPDYNTDILNVPSTVELATAISSLPFFSPPKKTTAEIALLVPTEGDLVYDRTVKEWKGYINGVWVTLLTNQ